ncbi:MAG: hypothetical protein K8I00_07875, partial [Candidatus Omnitrophica bacterium]|nr:hypothetical protein [Candidatus Omnitrophota bacterium]
MKNIHRLGLYFFVFIILIVAGVGLIFNRIQVMTIAHQRLIEERDELNQMTAFMTRIDDLMAVLVEQPRAGVFTDKELLYVERLAGELETIRASSTHSEKFEEASHSFNESQSFLRIYDEFQGFLGMLGDQQNWEGARAQLLRQLESMRQAGVQLQAFYIREMGDATARAQLIERQVMNRIVLISVIFLILLTGAAVWFVYLINKNTLMLIEREKNLTIGLLAQSLSH